MITRKRLTKRQRELLAYKQAAPIGTGPSIAEEKAADRIHRNAVIAATRKAVFARDTGCKGKCRRTSDLDQMHEVRSRAQLRNMPPEVIFNTRNCIRVCPRMHQLLTDNKADIIFVDDTEGCDAAVVFTGKGCDET